MDKSLFTFFLSTVGAVFLFFAVVFGVTFASFVLITKLVERKRLNRAKKSGVWWVYDKELRLFKPAVNPDVVGWDKYPALTPEQEKQALLDRRHD